MSISKILSEKNPLAIARRNKMQRELKNKEVSFLCPNCIGGILFHDLGLRFLSPTVNLMLTQTDFVKFVLNMDDYNESEFHFFKHKEYNCPCAYLGSDDMEKIVVHFTHYHTEQESLDKWKERYSRINRDNVFVFLTERDGITREQIESLKNLNVKGLVVFTANDYSDIPYTVQIKKYESDGEVGNILKKSYINDCREYEKYFDFVKWFNEANGGDYDVSKFVK